MEQTIESKVASAILEKSVGSIEIEGKVYEIASPSIATLILVSEIVSTLPIVERVPKEHIVYSALHYAKDYVALGEIAAVLILGAKNVYIEREEIIEKKYLGGLYRRKIAQKRKINQVKELAALILNNVGAKELFEIVISRLNQMEITNFFAITTSLSEANILKPTKGVEEH